LRWGNSAVQTFYTCSKRTSLSKRTIASSKSSYIPISYRSVEMDQRRHISLSAFFEKVRGREGVLPPLNSKVQQATAPHPSKEEAR
jgi:hypothetical protein